jgi:hypothetical protein
MSRTVSPTPEALEEALGLCNEILNEILEDIEISRVPLTTAAVKARRLATANGRTRNNVLHRLEAGGD